MLRADFLGPLMVEAVFGVALRSLWSEARDSKGLAFLIVDVTLVKSSSFLKLVSYFFSVEGTPSELR